MKKYSRRFTCLNSFLKNRFSIQIKLEDVAVESSENMVVVVWMSLMGSVLIPSS